MLSTSKKNVTLADVARAVGISKTTASHALSGKGYVSPTTRSAVEKLAQEMGFVADPLAQILSNGRCEKTVGFFTLDLDLSQRTRQLQIIQGELNDRGFSVPIYAYGYRGMDVLENQLGLINGLIAQRPRAIICNLSGVLKPVLERLARFIEDGGVAVCYGYEDFVALPCDQVIYAESESFFIAAQHLTALGHREIGFFCVGQRKPNGAILDGFSRALARVGANVRDEWLFTNDGTRRYEEDGARLGQEFLALKHRPSAMIVANDYAATAFCATVARGGIAIPRDLSVVGHDDDAIAPFGVVPLSTISAPVEKVAQSIVQLLMSRLLADYSGQARHLQIFGEWVGRESTGVALSP